MLSIPHRPTVIYLMGVSGSGKTTVGKLLQQQSGIPFYDGDDFHPPANIKKMSSGYPLDDQDRSGWLSAIHLFVQEHLSSGKSLAVACSALKARYREQLSAGLPGQVHWVYLEGTFEHISARLQSRQGHFMPPALLQSQFDDLEPPHIALRYSIQQPAADIAKSLLQHLTATRQ
ncbi:gluconokinase [Phaeodactylibacter luteus]|uniref:Gluconokinase n=1 Tax=Phaeodactylibacter luteus TaxID=1564516 RepID=A0A5C6S9G6_9BACT|nr:gluconokinase [Phaeodactylibacter luteus]TXB70224.1 gluconokinase [Phaeodactylibacter luteus]